MKPSESLERNRAAVLRLLDSCPHVANPRVFGSVARGEDGDGSDIDLLIDANPGLTLFALGGLQYRLQELLGVRVDLVTTGELPRFFKDRVLAEAVSL